MATYKAFKMNTTDGVRWSIYRWDGAEWYPSTPIRYYKSQVSAEREIKKRLLR